MHSLINKTLLEPFRGGRLLLSVSGGSDSLAMLYLLAEWSGSELIVVSFDHGFREESKQEIEIVRQHANTLGVQCITERLNINHEGNKLQNARIARFEALDSIARNVDAHAVLLGHTEDDVIEGFFMRVFRGAGVDGLARMKGAFGREVKYLRPLINTSREDLQNYLHNKNIQYIEDPSNDDIQYARVRARNFIASLMPSERQGALIAIENMGRARNALRQATKNAITKCVTFQHMVEIQIDREAFIAESLDVALRILREIVALHNLDIKKPRLREFQTLYDEITANTSKEINAQTLGASYFSWTSFDSQKNKIKVVQLENFRKNKTPEDMGFRSNKSLKFLEDRVNECQEYWRALGLSHRAAKALPYYIDENGTMQVFGQETAKINPNIFKESSPFSDCRLKFS